MGEELPDDFEVNINGSTWNLSGAIELHHLLLKDYDLETRKDEITSTIIDSTCSLSNGQIVIKEVNTIHILTFDEQLVMGRGCSSCVWVGAGVRGGRCIVRDASFARCFAIFLNIVKKSHR